MRVVRTNSVDASRIFLCRTTCFVFAFAPLVFVFRLLFPGNAHFQLIVALYSIVVWQWTIRLFFCCSAFALWWCSVSTCSATFPPYACSQTRIELTRRFFFFFRTAENPIFEFSDEKRMELGNFIERLRRDKIDRDLPQIRVFSKSVVRFQVPPPILNYLFACNPSVNTRHTIRT